MVPIVGTAITYGVLCAVPAVVMTYVVDCYRPLAGETMTVLTASKNTFAFALSFAVFPWLERDGYAKVSQPGRFLPFGGPLRTLSSLFADFVTYKVSGWNLLIQTLIFLLTIPMYIYGARLRKWTSQQEV
jgi:hypothetical protein